MSYVPNRNRKSTGTPSVIVFDVNETLIDIESIGPFFERKFGDRKVPREWFNQLILYSNVITLSGYYETFFTPGQGVLEMLGMIYGVSIKPADLEELKSSMLSMPTHKDVPGGLRLLKEAMAALPWNAPSSIISSSASSVSTVYAGLSLLPRFTISSPNS